MEWISTKVELPCEGERVLLYTPFEVFGDDHSCIGNQEGIRNCTVSVQGEMVPVFTHWMPLPQWPVVPAA